MHAPGDEGAELGEQAGQGRARARRQAGAAGLDQTALPARRCRARRRDAVRGGGAAGADGGERDQGRDQAEGRPCESRRRPQRRHAPLAARQRLAQDPLDPVARGGRWMTTKTWTTAVQTAEFPRRLSLKGRKAVQVRPMAYEDADTLHAFFCAIPEEDLLFLRRDVTDRDVIESWAQDVAAGNTFTLLADRDGRVVGEASIHRSRVPWTAHVGEIRVVVDAEHRTAGLGTALVQAIFLEALDLGTEKIIAEMTPDQKGAITLFQKLGFRIEGLLRDHVRDRAGQKRDLVVMAHEVHDGADQMEAWGISDAVERSR